MWIFPTIIENFFRWYEIELFSNCISYNLKLLLYVSCIFFHCFYCKSYSWSYLYYFCTCIFFWLYVVVQGYFYSVHKFSDYLFIYILLTWPNMWWVVLNNFYLLQLIHCNHFTLVKKKKFWQLGLSYLQISI